MNRIVHTQGVVLRYVNRNEADRLLTVLSPELGRILILARGCRKPKSRFLAASQLFCYCDLILQPYRDIYIMNQAEVRNSYFDIRNDLERLSYATYIVNLAEEAATAGESNIPLFGLLLDSLTYLAYGERDPRELILISELKLMDLMGYRPVLDTCMVCGKRPEGGPLTFSPERGGIVCGDCSRSEDSGMAIDRETCEKMREILDADRKEGFRIPISPRAKGQMDRILPGSIEQKLEKKIKSRDFSDIFFHPES